MCAAARELDGIVFVISCADPAPNRFVLDKLIAIADSKQIEPMIAFTKPDLQQAEELARDIPQHRDQGLHGE